MQIRSCTVAGFQAFLCITIELGQLQHLPGQANNANPIKCSCSQYLQATRIPVMLLKQSYKNASPTHIAVKSYLADFNWYGPDALWYGVGCESSHLFWPATILCFRSILIHI
ncbi:hypothetical protein F5Y15DRAFT_166403 [Xylariaceae sp. FL0016]|nr:hypothetical protein F5Y15DRAFT_166403 [Xylariaceae sp. FL0016]